MSQQSPADWRNPSTSAGQSGMATSNGEPYVHIIEQPDPKRTRFRYKCEGRCAGSIPGVRATPEIKTYPTIEIVGHTGRAEVIVSCVTKERPYKPHPHNLVDRKYCKDGVCVLSVMMEAGRRVVSFNFGIQCVKRDDIVQSLELRQRIRVDPFRTGFEHSNDVDSIHLKGVRLCFQVFLIEGEGARKRALPPLVSNVIYDSKTVNDYAIRALSHCSASAKGGDIVILLCNKLQTVDTDKHGKLQSNDISVTLFETVAGEVVWEQNAEILYVHKQVAIRFVTPAYVDPDTTNNVQVHIQLRGKTAEDRGEPLPFELIATRIGHHNYLKRKLEKELRDEYLESNRQYRSATAVAAYCPPLPPAEQPSTSSLTHNDTAPIVHDNNYQPQWDSPLVPEHLAFPAAAPTYPVAPCDLLDVAWPTHTLPNNIPVNVNTTQTGGPMFSNFQMSHNMDPTGSTGFTNMQQTTPHVARTFSDVEPLTPSMVFDAPSYVGCGVGGVGQCEMDLPQLNPLGDSLPSILELLPSCAEFWQEAHPHQEFPAPSRGATRHDGDMEALLDRFSGLNTDDSSSGELSSK